MFIWQMVIGGDGGNEMFKNKVNVLSTILFVVWSLGYIMHDLGLLHLDMDIIPLPVVIILYLATVTYSKKYE